jgi:hypothetical protein
MKKLIIIAIVLLTVGKAMAQDDITKQMEVTRAYTPKVGRAAKLPVEPRMVDTVRLRPSIQYSITPTAWQTVFETDKYAPAHLSVATYQKNRPLYVKAGLGYPFQTTTDLYFNPYIGDHSTFGMWLNHRGSYSRIENEVGLKPRSTEMLNGVGLYGSKDFGRRRLEGVVSYDHRIYNAYGVAATDLVAPAGTTYNFSEQFALNYGYILGKLSFGDTFTDLSRFNFGIGIDLGAAHSDSSFYQFDMNGCLKFGKMYGRHGFEVGLSERAAINRNRLIVGVSPGWGSVAVNLNPNYLLSAGKFSLRAGVDIFYIESSVNNVANLVPLPRISASLNLADGGFVPYLTLSTELLDGSEQALLRRNPYSRGSAPMGWSHDARVGFSGSTGEVFSYRLWGGASWLSNFTMFEGFQDGRHTQEGDNNSYEFYSLFFQPLTTNGMKYTVGAELGLNNLGGFSATLHGAWYGYELDGMTFASGMPSWDVGLQLAYEGKRFAVRAGLDVMGERQFLDYTPLTTTALLFGRTMGESVTSLGATIDVSLGAEYSLSETLGVFVEGRNLANQRLYPFAHYTGLGANLMLGIKATF